jgi:exonuclease SbcC
MKPIRLTLQNFGPYAGEAVVIDFTRLEPLFLITGDTGSGKTTLFDGVCYALYGEPLGTRTGGSLRAKLAGEGESTLAEFEFEVRGCRYLATRSPAWYEPRKKGGGFKVEEVQTLKLFQDAAWTVLAGRSREMKDQVEAILGLTHDEFAKILVLPQGEFQRFLEMGTGEREAILQKLFPIQEHQRLTELARSRADEARKRLQELQARLKEAQGDSAIDTDAAQAREADLRREAEAAAEALAAALARRDAARAQAQASRREAGLFLEQDQLQETEARFQAGQAQRDALDLELRSARRAAVCEAAVQRRADAMKALDAAAGQHRNTAAGLEEARAGRLQLQPALDQLPERRTSLETLKNQQARSEQQLADLVEIGRVWREGQKADAALQRAGADLQAGEATVARARREREALAEVERDRVRLQAELDRIAPLQGQLDRLQSDAEAVRAWPGVEARLAAELAQREAGAAAAETGLAEAEARVERLRREREADFAAVLAAQLATGTPCPVCGSCEHPHPARPFGTAGAGAGHPRLDPAVAAQAQAARDALTQARQRRQEAALRHREALAALQAAGWAGLDDYDASRQTHAAQGAALKDQLQAVTRRLAGREALDRALEQAERERDRARNARDEAQTALTGATAKRETLETSLGMAVPEPEQAYREARQGSEARLAAIRELERDLAALQERREQADQRIRGLEQLSGKLAELHGQASGVLDAAAAAMAQVLGEQGFASSAEQQAARRDPERMEAMERSRKADADAQILRLARLGHLAGELAGRERPDLDALAARQAAADAAYDQASGEARRAAAGLDGFLAQRERLRQLLEEIERDTRSSENLLLLADELEGGNRRRLKFSSWALAWWLERVLARASHRLDQLSGGRYRFRLRTEADDKRRTAGLEIDVHDAYANACRSVRTLSGGEKFLASLALALGLAEVIQSRNGGIELDALFIDEGFGSLDDDTLEKAMQVLDDLGHGRMVGLISHVEGMKRSITCQIRISRQEGGSRVEVVGAAR